MRQRRWLKFVLIVLAGLLMVVLVGPFLIPVPPAPGTVPASQLADPDSQFVEVNGLSVHMKTMGEGRPVFILLHGFGASLFSWHAVLQPLSGYGKVIAYDRPAFGLTERPLKWSGVNPYGPEGNISLLLGLMDRFDIQQAILVGNSAGGTLAMQFALANPGRVQALILVDPATGGGGAPTWIRLLGRTPEMRHLGPLFVRSFQKNGFDIIRRAWYDPTRITQQTYDGYDLLLKADDYDRAMWEFTMASHDTGLSEHLQDLKLPILVITGEADRIIPTADSIALAAKLPDARLAIIQAAGHVPQEEQPAAFMQQVESFLAALP